MFDVNATAKRQMAKREKKKKKLIVQCLKQTYNKIWGKVTKIKSKQLGFGRFKI